MPVSPEGTDLSRSYVQEVAANFKFRYVGLGFLWAWIYATWLSPVVYPDSGGMTLSSDISWSVSTASVAAGLFVIAFFLRDREISTVPGVVQLAGPLTALGAVCSASQTLFGVESVALSAAGGVVTGLGSALLWMLWGEFTGKVGQETAEMFVPLCVTVPLVVVFTCAFVSGPVACAAVCLLPVVSGLLLALCLNDEAVDPVPLPAPDDRPAFAGEFVRIGVGSVTIYVCVSFVWGMLDCDAMALWGGTHLMPFAVGAAAAIGVTVAAISFSTKLDLFGLYRWLIPIVLAALVFLSIDTFWAQSLSFGLITMGHFGFDVIVWLYFCRAIRSGACSGSFAIGVNRGFIQIGVFCGTMLAGAVSGAGGPVTFVALVLCAVLASVSLMVLSRQDSAVGPAVQVSGEEAEAPAPSSLDERCEAVAQRFALTPREREVFGYLARGRSLPYIRDELVLSKNTVSSHVKNIYKKLDVHSRQELFDLVEREGEA